MKELSATFYFIFAFCFLIFFCCFWTYDVAQVNIAQAGYVSKFPASAFQMMYQFLVNFVWFQIRERKLKY